MLKLFRIPLYFIGVILLIILAVVYIYSFTTIPESEINRWLAILGSKSLGLEVRFESINRDFWNGLEIKGLEIYSTGDQRAKILTLPALSARYDFGKIIKGNFDIDAIYVDSVNIWLPGKLPKEKTSPESKTQALFDKSINIDTLRISSLNLTLPAGDLISIESLDAKISYMDKALNLQIMEMAGSWPNRKIEIKQLHGGMAVIGNTVKVDSLKINTSNSNIAVNGVIERAPKVKLDLSYQLAPIDLIDVRNLIGVKIEGILNAEGQAEGTLDNIAGEIIVDGTFMGKAIEDLFAKFRISDKRVNLESVYGNIFHAYFDGGGYVDFGVKPENYAFNGQVRNLDLQNIGPKLLTDFTGEFELDGWGFNDRQFRMQITGNLVNVTIDSFYFDQAIGRVDFDLHKINFLPEFYARYKNTDINFAGYLEYLGDLDIAGEVEFADLKDFAGQIFLQEMGGKGHATVHATGPTIDFTADASFISDSCWTYGLEPANITIQSSLNTFITHRVGTAKGYWTGGSLYNIPVDSGFFTASISGEKVFIDSVLISSPVGWLTTYGDFDGTSIPPEFQLDTVRCYFYQNRLFSRSPIKMKIFEDRTEIDQFQLGYETGTASMTGTVWNDLRLDLDILAEGFRIDPVTKQVIKGYTLQGLSSGKASIEGTFAKPIMKFQIDIDSLKANNIELGKINLNASYQDGYLISDSSHLESEFGGYSFTGKLPLDLSFDEIADRLPENPIDFHMRASGNRLLLAEVFIPTVDKLESNFSADISLGGTYSEPTIRGAGQLMGGRLHLVDLTNPISNLRAYFRMENEMIYIDSAFGLAVQKGKNIKTDDDRIVDHNVFANGTLKIAGLGSFLMDAKLSGFDVYFVSSQFDVSGLADLNIRAKGFLPPTISGNVTLKRLEIRDDFDRFVDKDYNPEIIVEDSTLADLDLNIYSVNNLWVQNRDVDAECKGQLLVKRNVGILGILGTLDVIRGTYNLFGQKFRVKAGSMIFQNVSVVNPDMDFQVTTRIRNSGEDSQSPVFSNIELHIGGTLWEPIIEMGSETSMTREDFFKMLVLRSEVGSILPGSQSQSGFAQNILKNLGAFSSFVPNPLTGQGIVEEFSLAPSDYGDPQLSLAKYISRSLYVRYSRMLSSEAGSAIGVEYYLNDNISIQATQNLRGTRDEGISFDLNFNYEY